jgi:diaminopimelate decarboxylase
MEGRIRSAGLLDARVVVELGRYIVGECGVYVTRVVDRKESRGKTFLVVDGGMHHQLAASGNFGQVIRRNYPVAIGNRADREPEETATVVGCLCTPLDLLANEVNLPAAEVGDLVVIFQAGAYGLTASPTAFLGHSAPAEILV